MASNYRRTIDITTGNTITFDLEVFNQGVAYLITGQDATYLYGGGGNNQPSSCPATLGGLYSLNGNGYLLSGNSVNGVGDTTGLLQFDAQGNVTANFSISTQ